MRVHFLPFQATARVFLVAGAGLVLAGCAGIKMGGPALDLPSYLAGDVYLGTVEFDRSIALVDGGEAFRDGFESQFQWTVGDCARGHRTLDLRVRLDDVRRVQPIVAAMKGGANHAAGLVEFVDPSTYEVVGRYQVAVDVETGSGFAALLTDSYAEIGEAFGRELCRRAALIKPPG
ncbi:hypothetical protein D3C86_1081980 [compost metagenome]